ncbi:MAG: hypothetical protein KJ634_09675 [Gammaproteobacteria bacterium]|nr:hypothetical protein [Gammaproteobacteria bacterium]MBU1415878.1 hypothetical protein [Gammaproteobacteria bacterium]
MALKQPPTSPDQRSRASRKPGSAPPLASNGKRPAAHGLSTIELLAKINALDWDPTVVPSAESTAAEGAASQSTSLQYWRWTWLMAGAGALLFALAIGLYFAFSPLTPNGATVRTTGVKTPATIPASSPIEQSGVPQSSGGADGEASMAPAAVHAETADKPVVQEVDEKAQRRADRQRRARAAAAAKREREQLQAEEARLLAERKAAETAAAAVRAKAAQPKPPASPRELCAGETNIFSRGICESRACAKPEWSSHPFCVKRLQEQLRPFGAGA